MKNELLVFSNEEFGFIHTVSVDGIVWFVASDVANILDYRNAPDMTRLLDDDEKLIRTISVSGQGRKTILINESGLYHSVIKSRKPEAKSFRKWITNEILPSLRKTGEYNLNNETRKAIREKSKEIRNRFTEMQKAHGYTKKGEYIQTTKQMKQKLGITAKKDDMTCQELAAVSAAEWLSIAIITDEAGYKEVNPVCVNASETINNAIESKNNQRLLA